MYRLKQIVFTLMFISFLFTNIYSQEKSNWSIDVGIRGFKYSATDKPNEIQYNAVFDRWESINQNFTDYKVTEYEDLKPLYFNMNFGVDLFIRYKKYLMIKFGYDYSNPFGIGGTGNIAYINNATNVAITEEKEFSYTSHQVNMFIGPVVQVNEDGAEIYMGFSPMPPTWVTYKEKYSKTENGNLIRKYNKTFTGFFGNCRALFGIQIPVTKKIKLGSEAVFAFATYMKLESGNIEDVSFKVPRMKWNFTFRYNLL